MTPVDFQGEHVEPFLRFAQDLPDGDVTFIKEPISHRDTVRSWAQSLADRDDSGRHWVVLDDDRVIAFLAVLRLPGWSSHVGEIRLVVHPDHRGKGLGRDLARHALLYAAEAGLAKLVVEIVADDANHISMFHAMGFTGEALLRDHLRDSEGRERDLVMLAHFLEGTRADMYALGLAGELVE